MTRRTATWPVRTAASLVVGIATVLFVPSASAAENIVRSIFSLFGAATQAPANRDGAFAYAPVLPPVPLDIAAPTDVAKPAGHTNYCVRLCDGRFFPLSGMSNRPPAAAASMCTAMCPASRTAIYRGGGIEGATASNGSRYSDLTNAFVYRQKIIAGCTCNGKTPFGLAQIDVSRDPTLRAGDVVVGSDGLKVVEVPPDEKRKIADFTARDNVATSTDFRRGIATVRVASGGNIPSVRSVCGRGSFRRVF